MWLGNIAFVREIPLLFAGKSAPQRAGGVYCLRGSVLGEKRCNEVMNALLYG